MKRRTIGILIVILSLIGTALGFYKIQNDITSGMLIICASMFIGMIGTTFINVSKKKETESTK